MATRRTSDLPFGKDEQVFASAFPSEPGVGPVA